MKYKTKLKTLIINPFRTTTVFIWMIMFTVPLQAQNEAYYIELLNNTHFNGKTEVHVDGGRADIVNAEYAIEVEWANNWKHSIGQSLWYAIQLNKRPGIVLLMKTIKDRKYGIMLQSTIDYAGLGDKIKVWFYPEDFNNSFDLLEQSRQSLIQTNNSYTKNKNSGVRHNSRCTYYDCKNCVPCDRQDGKACSKCGG